MKIRITLKDPDGVGDSLDEAARDSLPEEVTEEDERDALYELKREKVGESVKKWIEYSEYVRIEIDTDAGTAVVLPVKD